METSSQLLKGMLEIAVLAVLTRGESYGYAVLGALGDASIPAAYPSVYGTLRRLEELGHLTSRTQESPAGPERRYYAITAAGRSELADQAANWRKLAAALDGLIIEAEEAP
jgi:PadR family transcriptional regulator PadR